jgi:hypothetical protein
MCVRKAAGLIIKKLEPTILCPLFEDNARYSVLSSSVCILAINAGYNPLIGVE